MADGIKAGNAKQHHQMVMLFCVLFQGENREQHDYPSSFASRGYRCWLGCRKFFR